nr:MAG TPA: hypothetical protein [Caudoviricetes sp.]
MSFLLRLCYPFILFDTAKVIAFSYCCSKNALQYGK